MGQGIKDAGVAREQLWLTSKLWNSFHRPEQVEGAVNESLRLLGTTYLDLYIIHWPVAFSVDPTKANGYKPTLDQRLTEDPMPTWRALEALVKKGTLKNIGISNFTKAKAQKLYDQAVIKPAVNQVRQVNLARPPRPLLTLAVNQVELSLGCPQPDLVEWSKKSGVLLESYSPLGSTGATHRDDPVVRRFASALAA